MYAAFIVTLCSQIFYRYTIDQIVESTALLEYLNPNVFYYRDHLYNQIHLHCILTLTIYFGVQSLRQWTTSLT